MNKRGGVRAIVYRKVTCMYTQIHLFTLSLQGCSQIGKAIGMAPTAVLYGLLIIMSFAMSHSVVEDDNTDWVEPVLVWIAICMPTGSGKSSLCKLLQKLVEDTRTNVANGLSPSLFADDQTLEKMGALMCKNDGRLLGLYDELPMFFSQMNIFHGKGITDSRELSVFLQLFGARSWARKTGNLVVFRLHAQYHANS